LSISAFPLGPRDARVTIVPSGAAPGTLFPYRDAIRKRIKGEGEGGGGEKETETGIFDRHSARVCVIPWRGISRAALNQEDIKLLVERLSDKRIDCAAMRAALKRAYRVCRLRTAKKVRLSSFASRGIKAKGKPSNCSDNEKSSLDEER